MFIKIKNKTRRLLNTISTLLFTAMFVFGVVSPSALSFVGGNNNRALASYSCGSAAEALCGKLAVKGCSWNTTTKQCDGSGSFNCEDLLIDNCKTITGCAVVGDKCQVDATYTPASKEETRLGEIAAAILSFATPLTAFMTSLCGMLLSNDWIYGKGGIIAKEGAQYNMEELLQTMWRIVRDIVNILFIVILLAIAFMNVLGAGQEWAKKINVNTVLPKIAIALVAVNFTWFGAKIVIDASNVATNAVFGLWQNVMTDQEIIKIVEKDNKGNPITICVPRNPSVHLDDGKIIKSMSADANTTSTSNTATSEKCKEASEKNNDFKYVKFERWEELKGVTAITGTSLMDMFAFGILGIETLPITVSSDEKLTSLALNSIAGLAIIVVTLVALFAMLVVLIVRVVMLWINIVFSPFFVIMPIIKQVAGSGGGLPEGYLGLKAFVKYAFLPALMAVPLVVGLIMVMVGKAKTGLDNTKPTIELINSVNGIMALMWYAMAIVVMWMSVELAVKHGGPITSAVVGSVSKMVKDGAKWVAKTPMYWKFLPTYDFANKKKADTPVSLAGMMGVVRDLGGQRGQEAYKETAKVMGLDGMNKRTQIDTGEVDRLKSSVFKSFGDKPKDYETLLKHIYDTGGDVKTALTRSGITDANLQKQITDLSPTKLEGLMYHLGDIAGDHNLGVKAGDAVAKYSGGSGATIDIGGVSVNLSSQTDIVTNLGKLSDPAEMKKKYDEVIGKLSESDKNDFITIARSKGTDALKGLLPSETPPTKP